MTRGLAITATLLLSAGPIQTQEANDLKGLAGKWKATSAQRDGKEAADIKGHILTFRDKTFEIRSGGKTLYKGTFYIDAARKPQRIDFVHKLGDLKGKQWLGILQWDGKDGLTICDNGADLDKGRPAAFESKPGTGAVLIKFTRDK